MPWLCPGKVLARSWPGPGQVLAGSMPGLGQSMSGLGQVLDKSWPGLGLVLARSWPGLGQVLARLWPGFGQVLAMSWEVRGGPQGSLGVTGVPGGSPGGSLGALNSVSRRPKHDTLSEIGFLTMNFGFEHRVLHHSAHRLQRAQPKTFFKDKKIQIVENQKIKNKNMIFDDFRDF